MQIEVVADARCTEAEAGMILEMFGWLKEKQLTAGQAVRVIDGLKTAIIDARHREANKIML